MEIEKDTLDVIANLIIAALKKSKLEKEKDNEKK